MAASPTPGRCRGRSSRRSIRTRSASSRSASRTGRSGQTRSEEHTSELQSHLNLVCRLLLEKKNDITNLAYSLIPNSKLSHVGVVATLALVVLFCCFVGEMDRRLVTSTQERASDLKLVLFYR